MKLSFSSLPADVTKKLSLCKKKQAVMHKEILKTAFAKVPFSEKTKKTLKDFSKITLPHFSRICVVGLGGSSLGTKAFAHAVGTTAIDFLDNVDPLFVHTYLQTHNLDETLFFVISKSGGTIEVIALTQVLLAAGLSPERIIGVSESNDNDLVSLLKKNGVKTIFNCDSTVPGRFSVLSPVGLLPLVAAGIDVEKCIAALAKKNFVDACTLASATYELSKKDKKIIPLFIYSEALNYFADWFVQLLAESIGKTQEVGLTPIKAVGVKDQHAQLQLFLDGPSDKFFIFIKPDSSTPHISVPGPLQSLNRLFDAEYEGVKGAFKKRNIPTAELTTKNEKADVITELFYFFEIYVAAIGMLFKIDYENQPAVELSKSITRSLLKKHTAK